MKRQKHRLNTKARLLSLSDLDHRTKVAQNCQRLIAGIQADLGKDLSTGQAELAKRAALLSALAEHCEVLWLRGQPIVIGDYTAVCNTLRRVLSALGLERQPREINSHADDARFQHVWPEYRQAEAVRSANTLDKMAALIDALDDEPPKNDAEPEEPQS